MARTLRDEILNVPNVLTLARIAMIPFVVTLLSLSAVSATPTPHELALSHLYCFMAAVLFGLAAVTDFLDGWLARNKGWTSVIGKLLDPVADKLIVMGAMVMLTELQRVPAWIVILLLAREIAISGLRSIAASEGLSIEVIQAGKWKTAFQLCGLAGLLLHYPYPINFGFTTAVVRFGDAGMALVLLSLTFSLVSAVSYFRVFLTALAAKNRAAAASSAPAPRA